MAAPVQVFTAVPADVHDVRSKPNVRTVTIAISVLIFMLKIIL
jgi:hypothetical protein